MSSTFTKEEALTANFFENSARTFDPSKIPYARDTSRYYAYQNVSPYLYTWTRLFQSVISQSATFMLKHEFHDGHCAIYKCEGGCAIPGVNDLVLYKDLCRFDYTNGSKKDQKMEKKCADLITHIVLNWNPNDPVDSMLDTAAGFIGVTSKELREAIDASGGYGPFGGNALSSFFDYNPFSKFEIDRDYQRYCLVNFDDKTNEDVDQSFADEDLGDELLKKMEEVFRKYGSGLYASTPMCCSPRRSEKGLKFWINTGRTTQIDGVKTEEEIEAFIKSIEKEEEIPKEFYGR